MDPETFIRHYEDSAWIIRHLTELPAAPMDAPTLVAEMLAMNQVRKLPEALDPAFVVSDPRRQGALVQAWEAIGSMFWGERISLEACCEEIREWLAGAL